MAEVESPVLFIVDGDQEARRATESTLVRRFFPDYRVLATSTSQVGPDELERLAERGDHVVLVATDLQLPGMARDHAFSQMAGGAQKEMKTVADSSNKTTANDGDVGVFLDGVTEDQRRRDAQLLVDVMREVTGRPPVMWGASIVGFGSRHYRYASGREGDVAAVAFSPPRHRRCCTSPAFWRSTTICCPDSASIRLARAACTSSGLTRPTPTPCEQSSPARTAPQPLAPGVLRCLQPARIPANRAVLRGQSSLQPRFCAGSAAEYALRKLVLPLPQPRVRAGSEASEP